MALLQINECILHIERSYLYDGSLLSKVTLWHPCLYWKDTKNINSSEDLVPKEEKKLARFGWSIRKISIIHNHWEFNNFLMCSGQLQECYSNEVNYIVLRILPKQQAKDLPIKGSFSNQNE